MNIKLDLQLKDRVIVVVGGTSNLGKGASMELCAEGAKVLAAYHSNDEKARKTEEMIRAQGGVYSVIKADGSQEEDVDRIFQRALELYGRIDGLIYSAMYYDTVKLVDMSLEHWNRAMAVNLTGVFLTNKWVVRYWLEHEIPGRIVNFTSVNAYQGDHIPHAYYAASKAGIIGFTKSLSHEVGKNGILANCVAPGFSVERELTQEVADHYRSRIPLGRIGVPADLSKMIAYLVSPANTYMLGSVVDISGGMIMH